MSPAPTGWRGFAARPALVATDIDGTLLDSTDRVPAAHREALQRVAAAGSTVCLATGRPPRWIPEVLAQLELRPFAVCANGAVIMDTATGQILRAQLLSPDELAALDAIIKDALPGVGLAVERLGVDAVDDEFVASPDYRHAWIQPESVTVGHSEVIARPALKMLARVPEMTSSEMAARVAPRVQGMAQVTFSTENGLIEFAVPGVSKAASLAFLADKIGLGAGGAVGASGGGGANGAIGAAASKLRPAHALTASKGAAPISGAAGAVPRTVAFGDMPNDIEMLDWAELGVAMGNAHDMARAAADEVTLTSDDGGLAPILHRWF